MTIALEPRATPAPGPGAAASERPIPHVVAWNLTRRCPLACAHCYISAGAWHGADTELSTDEALRIVGEILALNSAPMLILSGGEPLLRTDLEAIAAAASAGGATVVVGTSGTGLTTDRVETLKAAGVTGFAVSIDSLDPVYHDRFRHGGGALADALGAVDRIRAAGLDFIVQTTVTRGNRGEIEGVAEWAAARGAVSLNVYFVVPTGRAETMRGMTPAENEAVLEELVALGARYRGRMLVRSKCLPAIMRLVHAADPEAPLLDYRTRCPCGVQYCRITPEGKVTPCPYLPVEAGDLRTESFGEIWESSPLFAELRGGALEGKCGRCGYRALCGGCRARSWAESGALMGSDLACAYEPDGEEPVVLPRAVAHGDVPAPALAWDADAEARIARAPSFVRAVVAARVERYAAERGHVRVTVALLDEVRSAMPVDFSKAMPNFLKRGSA